MRNKFPQKTLCQPLKLGPYIYPTSTLALLSFA